MKNRMLIILALIMAGVMIAGCTQNPVPAATPVPTPLATPAATVPVPQPSFSMGSHYLQDLYKFSSEKDVFVEQVRVDKHSWGIGFDVLPLNEDLQYCWFEMKVTNIDTQQFDIFGFGRDKGFEKHQLYPMYTPGPYKIEMKGNSVNVDVIVATRNP